MWRVLGAEASAFASRACDEGGFPPESTKGRREAFLRALADTGIVTVAAGVAGVTRARAYQVRKADPAFAAAWDDAEEKAADALEAEAWRRAVVGVPVPLVSGGKVVRDDEGQPLLIRQFSDPLLITLLKAPSRTLQGPYGNRARHFRPCRQAA
jgi:hypothetical protein